MVVRFQHGCLMTICRRSNLTTVIREDGFTHIYSALRAFSSGIQCRLLSVFARTSDSQMSESI
jgi:hypothetical protein